MAKRSNVTKRTPPPASPEAVAYARVGKSIVAFDLAPAPLQLAIPAEVALRAGTQAWLMTLGVHVAKAAPQFEPGATTADMRELFLTKDSGLGAGILLMRATGEGAAATWSAKLSKSPLPYVLSSEAVEKGVMPPPGESWLPASLAAVVPLKMRFWELNDPSAALAARNELVSSGLFADDLIKLVDGELRLCTIRHFLYEPDAEQSAPEVPTMAKAVSALLAKRDPEAAVFAGAPTGAQTDYLSALAALAKSDAVVLLSADSSGDAFTIAAMVATARPAAAWLVSSVDTPEARASFASIGKAFNMPGLDALFVASFPPPSNVVWAEPAIDAPAAVSKAVRFLKAEATADERYVLGVVLEPETVDAQQDVYSAVEIRNAAHNFMENFGVMKLMHSGEPINDKVKILESYIAPVDFQVGDQVIKAGTWMMGARIADDDLWDQVKKGELTGYSIGGSAMRAPAAPPAAAPTPATA